MNKKGKYKIDVSWTINFGGVDYIIEEIDVKENKIIIEATELEHYKNKYEVKNE